MLWRWNTRSPSETTYYMPMETTRPPQELLLLHLRVTSWCRARDSGKRRKVRSVQVLAEEKNVQKCSVSLLIDFLIHCLPPVVILQWAIHPFSHPYFTMRRDFPAWYDFKSMSARVIGLVERLVAFYTFSMNYEMTIIEHFNTSSLCFYFYCLQWNSNSISYLFLPK